MRSWLIATYTSQVQVILLPRPVAGTTGTCQHDWLLFIFLVEMEFHHVGQGGLELLGSSGSLTLASESAGITGVNCAWYFAHFSSH